MTPKYLNIEGNQVMDLTPDYNRPLALVDLEVLNKLTNLLPRDNFSGIRHSLRTQIMNTENLEDLVKVTEDFIAFHKSVNLIREVCQSEITEVIPEPVKVVGKIDLSKYDRQDNMDNPFI